MKRFALFALLAAGCAAPRLVIKETVKPCITSKAPELNDSNKLQIYKKAEGEGGLIGLIVEKGSMLRFGEWVEGIIKWSKEAQEKCSVK
jgi:hypothetical protein